MLVKAEAKANRSAKKLHALRESRKRSAIESVLDYNRELFREAKVLVPIVRHPEAEGPFVRRWHKIACFLGVYP